VYRNRSVSLVLVGLFVWLTGCTSWNQIGLSEVADHGKVRVTLTDGEQETVYDPWVEADSIKGHRHIETLAVSVDRVAELESHSTNEVGTVFAVLGALLGVILVVGLATCDGYGCPGG